MAPEHLQNGVFITDRENVIILTFKRLIDMLKLQNVLVPTSLIYREKCDLFLTFYLREKTVF
jgi:hypothetical protein